MPPYQTFILHTGTPVPENAAATEFFNADDNGDERTDPISIATEETDTNSTEDHILDAIAPNEEPILDEPNEVPILEAPNLGYIEELINVVPPGLQQYARTSIPLIMREVEENRVTDPGQKAYILATAQHESLLGKYMEELASGSQYEGRRDLGNTQPGDGIRFKGRGYVQVTGRENYTEWSDILGIDLVANPERAAEPEIAAEILVLGMRDGNFTGRKLSDYINGDSIDFVNARRIVNGLDKAELIAGYAERYFDVLT